MLQAGNTPHLARGREVTVFGVPTIDGWRTSKGIEIPGPRHFGYDQDYVPMEKLI